MSDSELSTPANLPANDDIERSLRRAVQELNKNDNEVTVNKARSLAERQLGLDAGYLKDTLEWKTRSKTIIQDAVEQEEEVFSPEKPSKPAPKSKAKPKAKPASKAGRKRKSEDDAPAKKPSAKSARKIESEEDVSETELDDKEEAKGEKLAKKDVNKPMKRTLKKTQKARGESDSGEKSETTSAKHMAEGDNHDDEDTTETKSRPFVGAFKHEDGLSGVPDKDELKTSGKSVLPEDEESDLSSLIDEPPAKKKRRRKSTTASEPRSKAKASKKSTKGEKECSADEEEIKRLQGWLVKCGIRKMWAKELSPYPTAKEKVRHLKRMLEAAGMTGRYSNEKANQIKETRELAAELEAVEEFNERWGQLDQDVDAAKEVDEFVTAPKRRPPKGFIDFGDSGDNGGD